MSSPALGGRGCERVLALSESLGLAVASADLEATTGAWSSEEFGICEAGWVVADAKAPPGSRIWEYSELLDPGKPMGEHARRLTGIDERMLAGARPFSEIAAEVSRMLGECLWTGFGLHGMDMRALARETQKSAPLPEKWVSIDLRDLWISHSGQSKGKLAEVCAGFGLGGFKAHRALGDAAAGMALLETFLELRGAAWVMGFAKEGVGDPRREQDCADQSAQASKRALESALAGWLGQARGQDWDEALALWGGMGGWVEPGSEPGLALGKSRVALESSWPFAGRPPGWIYAQGEPLAAAAYARHWIEKESAPSSKWLCGVPLRSGRAAALEAARMVASGELGAWAGFTREQRDFAARLSEGALGRREAMKAMEAAGLPFWQSAGACAALGLWEAPAPGQAGRPKPRAGM